MPPARLVRLRSEIAERCRVRPRDARKRNAKGRQCLQGDDPGRNRGREVLRQKRTQRLVFPRLNIARRPIVEQTQPKHVRFRSGRSGSGFRPHCRCPGTRPTRVRSPAACSDREPAAIGRAAQPLSDEVCGNVGPIRRSMNCGRDSRSASTDNSASVDCRAETGVPTAVA